jgi:hypothetical protein
MSSNNPEQKSPLGRPRRRWVHDIKMDLREVGWGGMDWINLAQDMDQWRALVNTVMNLRILYRCLHPVPYHTTTVLRAIQW